MKKPVKKIGVAKNLKAASAMTNLPLHVVKSAMDAGCKAFDASGRVNCDELLEFVATLPEADDSGANYYVEKARDMRANRMLKEQKLRERDKLVWPIEKIKQSWTRNVIACKTKLMLAQNSVAVEAALRLNLTADQVAQIKEIHAKHNRVAMKELHAGEWGKVECPNCQKEIT